MDAMFKATGDNQPSGSPRGLGAVLSKQTIGFWGRVGDSPAIPDLSGADIPSFIYTFEPWLGCLWGTSCRFCYVPSASLRFYPGGKAGYWYQKWGHWLLPKPDITARLRHELLERSGATQGRYRGAFIYMSAKTDPFLPIPEALDITRDNLDTFLQADVFLMCQTRSPKVAEDPEIFSRITEMAKRAKVGVSFSISTDLLEEQRRIERGGTLPEKRLDTMARLKAAGVFVSAAVAPLMPYSRDFAHRLFECSHHTSIQLLKKPGPGASTPSSLLAEVKKCTPDYGHLDAMLAEELQALNQDGLFSWGINNKGFIGAFLSARRFYESAAFKWGQSRGG